MTHLWLRFFSITKNLKRKNSIEMVEAVPQGDGIVRNTPYGKWREDKEAEPGFSRELLCVRTAPEYYDRLDQQPFLNQDPRRTIM